jgi:histidinol-phosphate aminotransferase
MPENNDIQSREALQRITPYVPGKPVWEVQKELKLERVVKLASNENPLGASPKAIAAIVEFANQIHRYPDSSAADVRIKLAEHFQLVPEQFIVTNGADELITLISEAYLEPEDEIIVMRPSFSEYEFGANLMGAKTVSVPLGSQYEFDVLSILPVVTSRTKIIYICSPNNPTGTYVSRSDLQSLLDQLPTQVLVVLDSAYCHYATASDYTDGIEFVRAGYPVLVLQTFSKIYGLAGVRVGYGAAPKRIISTILKVKEPFNVNMLAQAAAAAALNDEEHVELSKLMNTIGREQLYECFKKLQLPYIESMSNFILVELGPDAKQIYDRLLLLGVIVRYGGTWGLTRHVRVTVGTKDENEFFIQSLSQVLNEIATT